MLTEHVWNLLTGRATSDGLLDISIYLQFVNLTSEEMLWSEKSLIYSSGRSFDWSKPSDLRKEQIKDIFTHISLVTIIFQKSSSDRHICF